MHISCFLELTIVRILSLVSGQTVCLQTVLCQHHILYILVFPLFLLKPFPVLIQYSGLPFPQYLISIHPSWNFCSFQYVLKPFSIHQVMHKMSSPLSFTSFHPFQFPLSFTFFSYSSFFINLLSPPLTKPFKTKIKPLKQPYTNKKLSKNTIKQIYIRNQILSCNYSQLPPTPDCGVLSTGDWPDKLKIFLLVGFILFVYR